MGGHDALKYAANAINSRLHLVIGARYGHAFRIYEIFKRKDFARWQAAEELPDSSLCKAPQEMEVGLVDAAT